MPPRKTVPSVYNVGPFGLTSEITDGHAREFGYGKGNMNITVNEELQKYIDPLTENEYIALERSLLTEGCRDALVLWGEVLIDGHNRYAICSKHGIAFKTVQNDRFENIEEVMLWMIDNQLSRRSVTDFQRGMLALRKSELIAASIKPQPEVQQETAPEPTAAGEEVTPAAPVAPATRNSASRQEVAKIAGVSSHTISQIEKIQKTAAPELIDAVRAGTISISAAAAVASLPSTEQVAAVAGGKKELRQVAKQVREQKAPPKPRQTEAMSTDAAQVETSSAAPWNDDTATLKAKIAALEAENLALKEQVATLTLALEDARRAA
jgi:hypothetical protein